MAEKDFQLVYPWDDSSFAGSGVDKASVYENLRKRKYPLRNMTSPPDEKIIKVIDKVLKDFVLKDRWVLVSSNSTRLLQAVANFCPVIYSLTTMFGSENVSTDLLVSLFSTRRPDNEFAADPVGDVLSHYERAGLLVWEDLADRHADSIKFSARFTALLRERNKRSCSTLFTLTSANKRTEAAVEKQMVQVLNVVGETALSIIKETAEFVHFDVPVPTIQEWTTYQVD